MFYVGKNVKKKNNNSYFFEYVVTFEQKVNDGEHTPALHDQLTQKGSLSMFTFMSSSVCLTLSILTNLAQFWRSNAPLAGSLLQMIF